MSVILIAINAYAQPETEVYLFDLSISNGEIQVENPRNVSNNEGYDNQPSFSEDSKFIFFASTRNGQTDIRKYDVSSGANEWVTNTEGSEYSPTPRPGSNTLSSILLEEDGRQLLWEYDLESGNGEVLIPFTKIGYHAWLDVDNLFSFVLGITPTFQEINVPRQQAEIILENAGRSIHKIPGKNAISFIDKNPESWVISAYYPETKRFEALKVTPEGSEDICWTSDQTILIGQGSRILSWKLGVESDWQEVVNLDDFDLQNISRMAISPDQSLLTVVVSE